MRANRYLSVVVLLTASCAGEVEPVGNFHPSAATTGAAGSTGAGGDTTGAGQGGTTTDVGSPGGSTSGVAGNANGVGTTGNGGASGDGGTSNHGGAAAIGGAAGAGGNGATTGGSGRDAGTGSGGASGGPLADAGSDRDAETIGIDVGGSDPEPGLLRGITRFHNQARATVGVAGLTWDPAIAATAAAYAANCVFQHSGTSGLGENLGAYAPPGGHTASGPVNDWIAESANYNYANNSCAAGAVCGHYTQVVWRNSSRLGCAVQSCSTNSPFMGFPNWEIWVCNYAPPGNVVGQKPY
jgi:pathogenesis-related protein 1